MHRTIPPSPAEGSSSTTAESQPPRKDESNNLKTAVAKLIAETGMFIVARRGCYLCMVVKALVETLGANPKVLEVEEEADMIEVLSQIEGGGKPQDLPAVYVGGKLLGGLDKVITTHVKGELVPMLREAGALWL
ncbi:unnamed protein product [Withania somnifera]